ncbi:MAG: hypothetical protein TEF_03420 [Rhizobiales bacterium NRL2]|nr:MAG: hypothetical protein TEF_03420 [Rhizobiales bacterium NRL2]
MAAHGRRPAAQTALLIVAPLLVLAYAGVIGWLWWAGPPEDAAAPEPMAETGEAATPPAAVKSGEASPAAEAPAPAPQPAPEPEQPAPEPAPQPEPEHPAPQPQPQPEPEAAPRPAPEPTPSPEPAPEGVEEFERTPLPPAPDPELTDRGRYGPLPVRSPDGRVAWQAYGRPFEREAGQPVIAIVMSEVGLAEAATLSAIQDLPGEISLAFSPYSTRLDEWVPAARAAGHEVLIQVPMEPRNTAFDDPGDKALLSTNQPEVNVDRLHWVLSRAVGYVGVTNFMGSRMTVSPKDMQPILEAIGARGLLYVDARVTPASIAAKLSAELGVPSVANDRFIDVEAARGPIDRRLSQLEELALARGVAVGFAQPYPVTIERLRTWIPQMRKRGFRLAPVSAVVRVGGGENDG